MKSGRFIAFGAVLCFLSSLSVAASGAPAPSFTEPVVAIPAPPGAQNTGIGTGGEPRLVVGRDGAVFVAAHFQQWDCSSHKPDTQTASSCVWKSTDARHFHLAGGDATSNMGDDVDLAITRRGTVLESAMTNYQLGPGSVGSGVLGTTVSRSGNRGRTWTDNVDANHMVSNDRPFTLATSRGDVFITYEAIPGGLQAVRSSDDGRSFGLPIFVVPPPNGGTVRLNGGPAEDNARRELLMPYAFSDDPTCTEGAAGCLNEFALARSRSGGTWTHEPVASLTGMGTTAVINVAADARGHEFFSFGGANDRVAHVYLAASRRRSAWSKPVRVDPAGGSAILPWVAAYGNGQIVVAYYGSPHADAQATTRPWYPYVARSSDGGKTFRRVRIGGVAYTGTGADHMNTIWDLLGLGLDSRGRAHVAWTAQKTPSPSSPTQILYAHER